MKTHVMRLKFIHFLFLTICWTTSLNGQVNFRIGYDLTRISSPVNAEMTEAFNLANPFLEKSQVLEELNYLNGLNLGISYKSKFSRIEIGWHTSSRTREAFGEKPGINGEPASSFEKSMRYRLSGFYISSEIILNRLGIGASLSNDAIRMRSAIAGSSNDKTITNQTLYAFAPFISYEMYKGKYVSLVLKPYFKLYLRAMNHSEIYQFLELNDAIGLVDRPYSFGFSFIFYNGEQN